MKILGHEPGPDDPDGIGYDVADRPSSHGANEGCLWEIVLSLECLLFGVLIYWEKKGMEDRNCDDVGPKAYIIKPVPL